MLLYIPHGSDERNLRYSLANDLVYLYIPHGSDESHQSAFSRHIFPGLYIPHGSDESPDGSFEIAGGGDFISHMVQMKGEYAVCLVPAFQAFISHMVQMKGGSPFVFRFTGFFFISHMVQMKVVGDGVKPSLVDTLYPTWFR